MGNFFKKNLVTIIITLATIVLAGVAIFTALRLYQLRQKPVAPSAPESMPGAQELPADQTTSCQNLTFTFTTGSPTPTPTPTVTPRSCNQSCVDDSYCTDGNVCYGGRCRNSECKDETDCSCPTTPPGQTGTPRPTTPPRGAGTARPGTTAPPLPESGVSLPTVMGIGAGALLLMGALLLAL